MEPVKLPLPPEGRFAALRLTLAALRQLRTPLGAVRHLPGAGPRSGRGRWAARRTRVFPPQPPGPAGHDAFPFNLGETHLAGCWGSLGGYRDRVLQLGAYDNGSGPQFNMTALALRSAGTVNAVSRLHGDVTRAMWNIWPGVLEAERPVTSVTNGVHVPTWIAGDLSELFGR